MLQSETTEQLELKFLVFDVSVFWSVTPSSILGGYPI